MTNIVDDLSAITRTKKSMFEYLIRLSIADISQGVLESYQEGGDCVVDIGIGTITIALDEDNAQFKFVPSKDMVRSIQNAVDSGKSDLLTLTEDKLRQRMLKLYKELL